MSDTPEIPAPGAPKEPLLTVGTITAIVTAGLVLLASWGVSISDDRQAAILGVVAVLAPLIVALIGRLKVWSPASVRAAVLKVRAEANAPRRSMPYTPTTDVRDIP